MFLYFVTLTFDLILNVSPGLMMDYPCGKFGDCSFSRFGSIIQKDRQTDTQTQTSAILSRDSHRRE